MKRSVAAYVIEEMLPMSTVESQSFRDILAKIPVMDRSVPLQDRKTFARYLNKCYADMELELKKKNIRAFRVFSTTADIWTSNNKLFLGINPASFRREKAAIACKRRHENV